MGLNDQEQCRSGNPFIMLVIMGNLVTFWEEGGAKQFRPFQWSVVLRFTDACAVNSMSYDLRCIPIVLAEVV